MHRSLRPSALIPPGLIVDLIHADPLQVTITVHSGHRSGVCPSCGTSPRGCIAPIFSAWRICRWQVDPSSS
jgi:hypothetical protein